MAQAAEEFRRNWDESGMVTCQPAAEQLEESTARDEILEKNSRKLKRVSSTLSSIPEMRLAEETKHQAQRPS